VCCHGMDSFTFFTCSHFYWFIHFLNFKIR
jgi:hypothetical protein